ncbi:hypothetical protein ACFX12_029852 [Malus domestica]
MGSEESHNTQNDTLHAPSAKQRKKEGKGVALQAKVDELEVQNNKIAMKNKINLHLDAPQHGGSPPFDMGIPNEERANH